MKMVPIKHAKDQLVDLVRKAEQGESVVITRNGVPVADLVPHMRKGGLNFEGFERWKAENGITGPIVTYVAPDFDDELPWNVLFADRP